MTDKKQHEQQEQPATTDTTAEVLQLLEAFEELSKKRKEGASFDFSLTSSIGSAVLQELGLSGLAGPQPGRGRLPGPRRYYSATFIAEHDDELALTFLTIPRPPAQLDDIINLAAQLDIKIEGEPIKSATELPNALRAILEYEDSQRSRARIWSPEADCRFFERLVFTPIIPFESSPLNAHAIASLMTQRSGEGVGAMLGVLTVVGEPGQSTMLLLLTVPLGIILAGTATGIARGLASGLEPKIKHWLTGHPPATSSEAGSSPSP